MVHRVSTFFEMHKRGSGGTPSGSRTNTGSFRQWMPSRIPWAREDIRIAQGATTDIDGLHPSGRMDRSAPHASDSGKSLERAT
jgi:hypothetical protein